MKRGSIILPIVVSLITLVALVSAHSEDIKKEDCLFLSSLHHTNRGMAYWYDKANGGLETLTGIPYSSTKLDCVNCHVSSCDVCHKTQEGSKSAYTAKAARDQEICLSCHKRERAIMKIDKDAGYADVHSTKKIQCMDCHTAREVHGDGTEYDSMRQRGALDANCGNCHKSMKTTTSHTIHGNKLDCNACHVRHVVSCSNCHIETLVTQRKRVDIKLSGWVFLMNYNGKVTSATMQTFVAPENKTFLVFAPQFSHSVMKEGRKCGDCHATEAVKQAQLGKINMVWLEKGEVKHLKGVVPVADGVAYESVYQNYGDGKWVPISNPPKPLLQYADYGTPLTKEQMQKLAQPMGK